jgi:hypothetical protein
MLTRSTFGFPGRTPIVALQEYGTRVSGNFRSRESDSLPIHLRKLDRLESCLPDELLRLAVARYPYRRTVRGHGGRGEVAVHEIAQAG